MTRRAFLQSLLLGAAAAAVGRLVPSPLSWLLPHDPAQPLKYPGPLRPLRNVGQMGIWKG